MAEAEASTKGHLYVPRKWCVISQRPRAVLPGLGLPCARPACRVARPLPPRAHLPHPPPLPRPRPRLCLRSSWTKRLITAYDYAAVQINIGIVNEQGAFEGKYNTVALCGYIRDKVRAQSAPARRAGAPGAQRRAGQAGWQGSERAAGWRAGCFGGGEVPAERLRSGARSAPPPLGACPCAPPWPFLAATCSLPSPPSSCAAQHLAPRVLSALRCLAALCPPCSAVPIAHLPPPYPPSSSYTHTLSSLRARVTAR